MKKTVSINIKGINFIIEEDAYELLQDYLERLETTLKNEEGSQEIIEDVELRIAEICSTKIVDSKSVIEKEDIQEILATLGNPEDYIDEESENENVNYSSRKEKITERRLFRDMENATVAGVCSGIANFFNIDVVIVRAIFVVFFLFAGFGLPLYLILWVIVPQTKSTIDRLRMKGKPITVEAVREEVENAAGKIKDGSVRFANRIRKDDAYQKSVSRGGRILSSIFGLGLIAFGTILLVVLIIFGLAEMQVIPVHSSQGFLSMQEFGSLFLANQQDYSLFWWGSVLATSSAILFLILLGSMFIFRLYNKWAKVSLLLLFILGVGGTILSTTVGARTGRDFFVTGELEHEIGTVDSDTLYLLSKLENYQLDENFTVKSNGNMHMMRVDDENITFHGIRIYYKESKDSIFHIKQNFRVQSHSHERALEKCKNIEHFTEFTGDSLTVSTGYSFPKKDKIRAQEVRIYIEIPKDGKVIIGDKTISLDEDDSDYDYYEHGKLKYNGKYKHKD
ncbi:MAG TPA: PspC domain-containing protein [Crocinitomicaceae bacterium]|nr:PspC domain-containing protein [Crocinitomicaceae bacterium]